MTKIEWTDATWNPIRARNRATGRVGHFCVHVSEACRNCYAERLQPRFGNPVRFAEQDRGKIEVFLDDVVLRKPLGWRTRRMVFVCSMTDLFAEWHSDEMIDRVFAVMALCPQHSFQVLTKRPERMKSYVSRRLQHNDMELAAEKIVRGPEHLGGKHVLPWLPLPNVWLGTSVEDRATAEARIPLLLETPAALRWISAEPLLGPVDLTALAISGDYEMDCLAPRSWREVWEQDWAPTATCEPFDECKEAYIEEGGVWPPNDDRPRCVDWVICGGESGPQARPLHPDWVRSLRDQCVKARVPFFFKQWGEWAPGEFEWGELLEHWLLDDALDAATPRGAMAPDDRLRYFDQPQDIEEGTGTWALRVGKKAAGRVLDGAIWNQFPSFAPASAEASEGKPSGGPVRRSAERVGG